MREFKVFVSSTFRDMYAERDVLHRQVSAILAKRIADAELNCTVRFVDLRWGIDDRSDLTDRSEFIIEKCFDSIRECDLFLCILGEKIGTPVEREILARYSDLDDGEAHGYTELEIEYAKKHFDRSQIIFLCSSESESEEAGARRLKSRIALDFECLEYDKRDGKLSPEFITHSVNTVFEAISKMSEHSRRQNPYFRREALLTEIERACEESGAVLLWGENGAGKSALLNCLAIEYESRGNEVYLSEGLKKGINSTLPHDLSIWVGSEDERLSRDIEALKRSLPQDTPVFLMVDKIDDEQPGDIFMLCRAFSELKNVTVLMTLSDPDMLNYLKGVDVTVINVGGLSRKEIAPYMLHIANRYGKRIFPEIVDYVASMSDSVFSNALYLELLTDQLCIMDSAAYTKAKQQNGDFVVHIIDEMKLLIGEAPRSIPELIRFKISDFDKYLSPEFSGLVIGTMAAYRSPIHLSTLRDVYEALSGAVWDDINYYTLCYYLREFIVEVDEHLYYISPFVKEELESKFYTVDNDKCEEAIYASLSKSGIDDRRLYFAALNLGMPEFYDELTGEHRAACINALWSYLESESRSGVPIHLSGYYERLGRIVRLRGSAVAVGVFEQILHLLSFNGNMSSIEYVSKSYRRLSQTDMSCETRMHLCRAVLTWFNLVGLEHYAEQFIKDSLDLLVTPQFHSEVGKQIVYKDFFDFFYYVIVMLKVFDQRKLIDQLLSVYGGFCVKVGLVRITPLFAEAIIKLDEKLFVEILDSANEPELDADSALVGAYINVLKYKIYRALEKKDTDTAYLLSQKMYELARARYEDEPSDTLAMYDYSQALGLYSFIHQGDREDLQREMLDDMYKLRIILAYAQPDNRVGIEGLSVCIVNIIRSDVNISVNTEEMLTTLFERIRVYAQRGNIQTGWVIVNLFRTLRTNRQALDALRMIIGDIGNFLEPIIVNTRGNTDNLCEIIRAFLEVYHSYCEAQILPLDEGYRLLSVLSSYAVRLVDLEANEENCALYHITFRELITVLMQGCDFAADVLKSEYFIQYEAHVISTLERTESDGARMLATTPDGERILIYSMLLAHEPRSMRTKVFELKSGGSLVKLIKRLVLKNYGVLKEYMESGKAHGSYLETLYLGAQMVKKKSPSSDAQIDEIIKIVEKCLNVQQ